MSVSPQPGVTYRCKGDGCKNHTMRLSRLCLDCTKRARAVNKPTPSWAVDNDHARHEASKLTPHDSAIVYHFLRTNESIHNEINAVYRSMVRRCAQYGIPFSTWLKLIAKHEACCAICRRRFPVNKLCIDHDHHSGHVRGLLCTPCNTGLGALGIDGPNSDERAGTIIEYLAHARTLARTQRRRAG